LPTPLTELTALPRDPPAGEEGSIPSSITPPVSVLRASLFGPSDLAVSVDSHSVVDGLAPMSCDLVYVCPSVASGYCIRTAELFELVYGIEASLGPSVF